MKNLPRSILALLFATFAVASLAAQDTFRFRTGVELINVTATVTDDEGRFVSGLRKEDFTVFDEGVRQEITHFSNERVPVSLGIVLDTSGSMTADKMSAARAAIDRFIYDLLGNEDELFFVEFANDPRLVQDWTTDRRVMSRAISRVNAGGGTAIYDAVAAALPIASTGTHTKKAMLIISDGNDTNSTLEVRDIRQMIRESEVLVYALGVDGTSRNTPTVQLPIPIPFPGGGRRSPPVFGGSVRRDDIRVNADALRQITDDTGGRTEIVRGFGDLDAATARIADELSKQYYLGYSTTREKDGRWHTIRVDVRGRGLTVRARRGYTAS